MAQAAVFSLFGGTSISIAGPAPSGAAIAARGRGAGRHVRVPCPVECPHACPPPPPPPSFLCRGRTLVTRHPRSSSARRVASVGAGRDTDHGAETAGGKAPNTCASWLHTCSDGNPVSTEPEQPCPKSRCVDRHLGYIKELRRTWRWPMGRLRLEKEAKKRAGRRPIRWLHLTHLTEKSRYQRRSDPPSSSYRAEQAKNCPRRGSRAKARSASPTEGSRDFLFGRPP
jgi:hypothetical protein